MRRDADEKIKVTKEDYCGESR